MERPGRASLYEPTFLERENHLMNRRRRDLEEPLNLGLRWWPPVELGVIVMNARYCPCLPLYNPEGADLFVSCVTESSTPVSALLTSRRVPSVKQTSTPVELCELTSATVFPRRLPVR